jgi:septum formation protein
MRLVLASASPRRADLLRAAGFDFEIRPTDVDESPRPDEDPAAYVLRLAREKSAVANRAHIDVGSGFGEVGSGFSRTVHDRRVIIAADTAVVLDRDILGKPSDRVDAERMLVRLSGRRHDVLTGLSLREGPHEVGRVETTSVEFKTMSSSDLEWYLLTGEWSDKAGAYGIQGLASRFIGRIEGSYSNVVGLPVATFCELLRDLSRLASAC